MVASCVVCCTVAIEKKKQVFVVVRGIMGVCAVAREGCIGSEGTNEGCCKDMCCKGSIGGERSRHRSVVR